jgi:tetratricopeptide (TPR) repeat protein
MTPRWAAEGPAYRDLGAADTVMSRPLADLAPPAYLPSEPYSEMTPDAQHQSEEPPAESSRSSRFPSVSGEFEAAAPVLPAPRGPTMDGVSERAAALSRRAYQLADRGALYSARANFIQSLQMVTQALDARPRAYGDPKGTLHYGRALAAGLLAMKEAEDFVPRGTNLEADINVSAIIAGHRTPILKPYAKTQLTQLAAMQHYFSYAQRQLTAAGGSQRAASMALHGLGKVQSAIAAGDRSQRAAAGAKAIVLQRAALAVDSRNYLAANELGVLLARYGQLDEARSVLLHSVSLEPDATTWHNLAVVHRKLNEPGLAERAESEAQLAARPVGSSGAAGTSSAGGVVQWVSPQAFAGNRPVETRRPSARAEARPDQRHAKWWESILIPWK